MDVLEPPSEHRRLLPVLTAVALGAAYLVIQPPGADLPAQLYRVHLFQTNGFSLWDNFWYAGHNVLAYSVLFPPLGALLTPRLLAVVAFVATAALAELLAHRHFGRDAWVGATWLTAGLATELVSGRLTFALGLLGVAATALLLRLQFERPRGRIVAAAAAAAVLTALASPVAALFAALVGLAPALAHRRDRRALWSGFVIVIASILPVLLLTYAFPEGGYQPDAFSTVWPVLVAGAVLVAVAVVVPRHRLPYTYGLAQQPTLAIAVALYLLGCLAAFGISTPVGANANRLGELLAGPLLAFLLWPLRRDRRALAVLVIAAVPLTYIQVKDAVSDVARGSSGGAYTQQYYAPLLRYLHTRPGAATTSFRLEVPMTRGHWESYYVASEFPLARGWERQVDIAENPLFYSDHGARDDPHLSPSRYLGWLHRHAVTYIAVADAPPDYSSQREVELIDRGLPYLREIKRLPHWRIYAVSDPTPIVTGAATLTAMGHDLLLIDVRQPGTALVRVQFSPYMRLNGVRGCVAPAGEFTSLRLRGRGPASLSISFAATRIRAVTPRCN